jgi:hypothetical protein
MTALYIWVDFTGRHMHAFWIYAKRAYFRSLRYATVYDTFGYASLCTIMHDGLVGYFLIFAARVRWGPSLGQWYKCLDARRALEIGLDSKKSQNHRLREQLDQVEVAVLRRTTQSPNLYHHTHLQHFLDPVAIKKLQTLARRRNITLVFPLRCSATELPQDQKAEHHDSRHLRCVIRLSHADRGSVEL